jgi:hypothetical protein
MIIRDKLGTMSIENLSYEEFEFIKLAVKELRTNLTRKTVLDDKWKVVKFSDLGLDSDKAYEMIQKLEER